MFQKLSQYDPYTIEEVEFFIQKKTKYTTLKSIIISLVILVLTLVLNLGVLEQLWVSRGELPTESTQRKMSLQPFSQAYLCLIAKTPSTPLSNSTVFTFGSTTNRTVKTFMPTEIFNENQQIINATNNRPFQCYNIEGAIVNNDMFIRMVVYDKIGNFDFMIKTFTAAQILGRQSSNYFYFQTPAFKSFLSYDFRMKKIHGLIYDKLLIDYEPQRIFGFSPIRTYQQGVSDYPYSFVDFTSQFVKPYDTTTSFILKRANIGQILGKLLSWFSIFVMLAAFGISPILEFNYRLQLSKKLYNNKKLNQIEQSFLSYLRYLISCIKSNLFSEDILHSAFEQLEKDLDLMNLIKKQCMMKKLIKENQFVNTEIVDSTPNNFIQEDEKQSEQLFVSKFLGNQLLSEDGASETRQIHNHQQQGSQYQQSNHSVVIVTEPDPLSRQSFISSAIKSLDCSETSISLISNKGEGYKTSWNTILTAICVAGVLWFLIFAGIFEMTPNHTISTIIADQDEQLMANITIYPEDILFRANKTNPSYNYILTAFILDQDDNIIDNLTLLNGTNCNFAKSNLNETTTGWMCLDKPVYLYNNGKGQKTKLGLRLKYLGMFAFSVTRIQTLFYQYNIVDNTLIKSKFYTMNQYSTTLVYRFDGQAIVYKNQDQEVSTPEYLTDLPAESKSLFWTCNKAERVTIAKFKGITYQLSPQLIRISKEVPTIWDVIDTAWGIVILAFSIFLSKFTRYLNIKERQKIVKGQQNQNRNDIINIISTQYKLIYTLFYKQLQQVKYFYKTKLENFNHKST